MAEQFVLKGVKELRDYKTDSSFTFQVKNNPRGGDTWQIPTWFAKKGNNVKYIECTVLDLVGTNYLAIIPTSPDTQLQFSYDDDVYNIGLTNFSAVDRVAITSKDTKTLVLEYMLPSISGGAIAKRILQNPATIGAFTITGPGVADVGQSKQYKSNATPDASDAVYTWTVEQSGSAVPTGQAEITAGQGTTGVTVAWKAAGDYDVKCVITSSTASDSPQSDTRSVTVSVAETVGTVTVSGSTTPEAQKASTYTVSTSGGNVSNLTYAWSVVDADAQISNPTADSTGITFSDQGNATVQCIVGSEDSVASDSDTLAVVVSTAKLINSVTVQADSDTVEALTADNFQCLVDSNIVDATYQWSVSPSAGVTIAAATAESTNITFANKGDYQVTCKVSSATAQNSPQTTAPVDITVTGIASMPSVTLGGPTTVNTLNVGKNYTSTTSDGSTLSGTTTYQWTAEDENGNKTENGAVFSTVAGKSATDQNTQVTFTIDGKTYKIRCKYTNNSYADSPKTGMRTVTIDTTAPSET